MKYSRPNRSYTTESISKGRNVIILGDEFHHLKSVMRMKLSDEFRLFNDIDGEFLVKITEISKSNMLVQAKSFLRNSNKPQELTLAMCIIKPDRMLEAIKASVQLGVTQIIPIISERTQYKQVSRNKIEKSIILSTVQSERFYPPKLMPENTLSEFCKINDYDQIIFANEVEEGGNKIVNINKIKGKVAILIGPEGGFSQSEIDMIKSYNNVSSVSLGRNVLRAEIAAISTISCVTMLRKDV